MYAKGWAVIRFGEVNVRTVSPTRRAAIVNWLVVEKGVPVSEAYTDQQIEDRWNELRGDLETCRVRIQPLLTADVP